MGFHRDVPSGGYAWWYVDALSHDGRCGITLIAFVGSVFSPYYARSRRRGAGDPLQHCALNIALYGPARRWAMTERGSAALHRSETDLTIGPSALHWDGTTLTIRMNERTVPFPRRINGEVRIRPQALTGQSFRLDTEGRHHWSPLAPRAHVEVTLKAPELRWSGVGYLDHNNGDVPLEDSFSRWTWSRAGVGEETAVLYEVTPCNGAGASLALRIARCGAITDFAPPPPVTLRPTRWRVARGTRADDGQARVRHTLEDTPFYARSLLDTRLLGQSVVALHESLSLTRFRSRWVQAMLPFRMPRVAG